MRFKLLESRFLRDRFLFESKADIQRFIDKFGQDIYDRLQRNKQKILNKTKDPKNVDITYLTKNATLEQVEEILAKAEEIKYDIEGKIIPKPTNTKKLVFNGGGVKVYKVFDVEDMMDIGEDTGWCIAGKYMTNGTKVSQAKTYFPDYKSRLGLECYYVFVKNDGDKYCALLMPSGEINSIWNKADNRVSNEDFVASVGKAAEVIGLKDWNSEIFVYDGTEAVPEGVVNVEISDDVTEIGELAFAGHKVLKSVKFNDKITKIGSDAFNGCVKLSNIELPQSLSFINPRAFSGCKSIDNIDIPDSVIYIGEEAFAGCRSLGEITVKNATVMGACVFEDCVSLKDAFIGNGISGLPKGTFIGCRSLKNVTLPNRIDYIGKYAFAWCSSLENIDIPKSVTFIDNNAFEACNKLKTVVYGGSQNYFEDEMSIGRNNEPFNNAEKRFTR